MHCPRTSYSLAVPLPGETCVALAARVKANVSAIEGMGSVGSTCDNITLLAPGQPVCVQLGALLV